MMKLILSIAAALLASGCSQTASPPESAQPPSVVQQFQTQWITTETPKLSNSREYWDKRAADVDNVSVSEQSGQSIAQELAEIEPNVLKVLLLSGSVDAISKAELCSKIVVRGEREGGLPQIVAYLDVKTNKLLLSLFYNDG